MSIEFLDPPRFRPLSWFSWPWASRSSSPWEVRRPIATHFLWGPQAPHMVANRTFTNANSFVLPGHPHVYLYGLHAGEETGIARDLYDMMFKWGRGP